jgi:hypothetical protein
MSLLRFYILPRSILGRLQEKKGNKLKMTMKNRIRNRNMKKIVQTGNFPQNGKQSDLGLVSF